MIQGHKITKPGSHKRHMKNDMKNGSKNKKKTYISSLAIVFVLVLVVAVWYGFEEYNRKPQNIADAKPDFKIADTLLIKEFEANAAEAGKKYTNRLLFVSGYIKKLEKKGGAFTLSLGSAANMSSVLCAADSTQQPGLLKEGAQVTLKGVLVGFNGDDLLGFDVILNRCVITNK